MIVAEKMVRLEGLKERGGFHCKTGLLACASAIALPSPALAQTAPPPTAESVPPSAAASAPAATVAPASDADPADIVVTAQRRAQRVQDIPYNITVVGASALGNAGAGNVNDLTRVVSGLGNIDAGPVNRGNQNNFTLRGLRTDSSSQPLLPAQHVSSVSTYYGDTPVFFPLFLKDIDHVEVLRGPQGTLYGSGAQAGAIRFIPNRPDFDKFSGQLSAAAGITEKASFPNDSIDATINIPLTDHLALRLNGAYERLAGFIDKVDLFRVDANGVPTPSVPGNLASGPQLAPVDKDTNTSRQVMGRAALRYAPTDWLDLEASYLHQDDHADDVQESNPFFGGGTVDFSAGTLPAGSFQARPGGKYASTTPNRQPFGSRIDLFTHTGTIDFGFASLTSATSYYKVRSNTTLDITGGYITPTFNFLAPYAYYPRFTGPTNINVRQKGFVEEIRLVSKTKGWLSYVFGAYYENQNTVTESAQTTPGLENYVGSLGLSGANPSLSDLVYVFDRRNKATDKAVFGEITVRPIQRWQITGGFRVFKDHFDTDFLQQFPYGGVAYGDGASEPANLGTTRASASQSISNHVFKLNTSFDFSPHTKVYATYARGFRRGGSNGVPISGAFASLPQFISYKPDFADNYEVGIKGDALDRRVQYSLSLYRIYLKDFQFDSATPSGIVATFNGNKARSQGVEAEALLRVTRELSLTLGYSYTDAKVTRGIDIYDLTPYSLLSGSPAVQLATSIPAGRALPGVSKHSATAALDYTYPLVSGASILFHADGSYRSPQNSSIDPTNYRYFKIPSIFMGNIRVVYDTGHDWTVGAFVENLTNTIGYSGGDRDQRVPTVFSSRVITRPRTAGVTMGYRF